MKRSTKRIILLLFSLALIAAGFMISDRSSAAGSPHRTAGSGSYGNLMKVKMPSGIDSRILHYKGMDVSFNPRYHIPNWVAWELTGDETSGEAARTNKFQADPNVAESAESYDYNYSGYDRGHMAPAGDMKWDKEAMSETFYMTNICPQTKALNSGSWKNSRKMPHLGTGRQRNLYCLRSRLRRIAHRIYRRDRSLRAATLLQGHHIALRQPAARHRLHNAQRQSGRRNAGGSSQYRQH